MIHLRPNENIRRKRTFTHNYAKVDWKYINARMTGPAKAKKIMALSLVGKKEFA